MTLIDPSSKMADIRLDANLSEGWRGLLPDDLPAKQVAAIFAGAQHLAVEECIAIIQRLAAYDQHDVLTACVEKLREHFGLADPIDSSLVLPRDMKQD